MKAAISLWLVLDNTLRVTAFECTGATAWGQLGKLVVGELFETQVDFSLVHALRPLVMDAASSKSLQCRSHMIRLSDQIRLFRATAVAGPEESCTLVLSAEAEQNLEPYLNTSAADLQVFGTEFFEQLIAKNPFPIAIWNEEGYFLRCNQAFLDIFVVLPPPSFSMFINPYEIGTTRHEAMERLLVDLKAGEPVRTLDITFDINQMLPHLPSNPIRFNMIHFCLRDETGGIRYRVTIYENITEQKNALEAATKVNQEKYEQARQIAGGISHEIYNSLFPASSALHQLSGYIDRAIEGEQKKELLRLTRRIDRAVVRGMEMVESVKQFTRLDADVDMRRAALYPAVLEAADSLKDRCSELGVTMTLDVAENLNVRCSSPHLKMLFLNLLSNAIDAVAESPERVVTVSARDQVTTVVVSVSDTGQGIQASHVEKIFEPFYTTKPDTGTGLGLAIVRKILELYEGTIVLRPRNMPGTTFEVTLQSLPFSGREYS